MLPTNNKRFLKWDKESECLYLRIGEVGEPINLGNIRTKKGKLTQEQKLQAVQFTGEWIAI